MAVGEEHLRSDRPHIDRRRMMCGTLLAMASAACESPVHADSPGNVRKFGAKGDGITDDAPAIQRAIDAAAAAVAIGAGDGTVTLDPGTYMLFYRVSEDGDGASALTLRSGVTIVGSNPAQTILKLADGQLGPGTYARMIASKGDIARAGLRSFTIDGNRDGQGQFRDGFGGAAILLGWKGRCVDLCIENMIVRDAVGQGIMLQGSIGNVSRNLRIANNLVERTAFIGIQCSQFDGVEIIGNEVNDCHDNAIDIYGDDTGGGSTIATSHRATIADNRIRGCSIGVFLETVADCVAQRNFIDGCRIAGVRINRIHGEPRNLSIERNRISGTPIGIAIGGDTGGVVVRENEVRGFSKAGIEFSYNVSRISIVGNHFLPMNKEVPIIFGHPTRLDSVPAEQLAHIDVHNNAVARVHDPAKLFVNDYRRTLEVNVSRFTIEGDFRSTRIGTGN